MSSGHTSFTWWINTEAKTATHKGVVKNISGTHFVPAPGPNNDDLVISFGDGTKSKLEDVDSADLLKRFHEYEEQKNKKRNEKNEHTTFTQTTSI